MEAGDGLRLGFLFSDGLAHQPVLLRITSALSISAGTLGSWLVAVTASFRERGRSKIRMLVGVTKLTPKHLS
jgi:hypothetical protein